MRTKSIFPECTDCGDETTKQCDSCGELVCDVCERDGMCKDCADEHRMIGRR